MNKRKRRNQKRRLLNLWCVEYVRRYNKYAKMCQRIQDREDDLAKWTGRSKTFVYPNPPSESKSGLPMTYELLITSSSIHTQPCKLNVKWTGQIDNEGDVDAFESVEVVSAPDAETSTIMLLNQLKDEPAEAKKTEA